MNFYKSQKDNFFIQLDDNEYENEQLSRVLEEKHEGDETKHQPIITHEKNHVKIKIGDIMHPMSAEHHITMIFLKTSQGGQYKLLSYLDTPIVTFELSADDEPIEVYGYCNIHGIWKELL